ncbi:MAG: signal peptidase I [Prevotella sp.]|nr:signal peptidase I [Prevotella sp.]
MRGWLKFVMAIALAMALMLIFRTLVFSVHSISGNGLAPLFDDGDQLLVNRCSYGLRIAGNGLLPYSRLWHQPVQRGDIVAFTVPATSSSDTVGTEFSKGLFIARCLAGPGDTIRTNKGTLIIPGLASCADSDYYWLEAINRQNPVDSRHLGFIAEQNIIGRVVTVLYNRHHLPTLPSINLRP